MGGPEGTLQGAATKPQKCLKWVFWGHPWAIWWPTPLPQVGPNLPLSSVARRFDVHDFLVDVIDDLAEVRENITNLRKGT